MPGPSEENSTLFTLDECLDLIQDASVKVQGREKIKTALQDTARDLAAVNDTAVEKEPNWLMGRCLQYFDAVRATWPQDQWRYAKKPAEFLIDRTWKLNPVIWNRSQQPPKEKERGNSSNIEELRRLIAAARAKEGEPDGVLEPVSAIDGSNPDRRAVSSLFPNRSQLAPNGHRSGVQQTGALAQILKEPRKT